MHVLPVPALQPAVPQLQLPALAAQRQRVRPVQPQRLVRRVQRQQPVRQVPMAAGLPAAALIRTALRAVPVLMVEAVLAVAVRTAADRREAVTQEEVIPVVVLVAAVGTPVAEEAEAAVAEPVSADNKKNKVVKRPPYLFARVRAH